MDNKTTQRLVWTAVREFHEHCETLLGIAHEAGVDWNDPEVAPHCEALEAIRRLTSEYTSHAVPREDRSVPVLFCPIMFPDGTRPSQVQ